MASFAVDYLKRVHRYIKEANILDIGCGYSREALYLSQHIDYKIINIDSSKEDVKKALQNLPDNNAREIKIRC